MGVRLVRYNRDAASVDVIMSDHDELINRDLMNQHPIYAIIGLQEILNILEDSIDDTNELLLAKEKAIYEVIKGIQDNIADIEKTIADILNFNVINEVEETYSLKLSYDETTKTLKGDVKVYKDKDDSNAIQVLAEGLYVPKTTTEDSETVTWKVVSLGETLKDIFDNGIVFSHTPGSWSNLANTTEANAWYWDDNLQSFVQPRNTGTFTGFVTQNFYDYYTHTVTLRSTDSDNDDDGVIIGFVFDENGNPHTLSAMCCRRGTTITDWALVYDYMLPDQQIICRGGNGQNGTVPGGSGSSGWNGRANGITVNVTKFKNIITATCSDWNTTTLNEATKITIDLNDYSWGYLFKDKVRYGYCNYSQAYSFFQNIQFKSDNTAQSDKLIASVKISQEVGNGIIQKDDGIFMQTTQVSQEPNNTLIQKPDGLYVEALKISPQADNAIESLIDGLYVRKHENMKAVTQAAHDFIVGDFIYYHPSGYYAKALAVDDYDSNIVGMVTKVINADNFEYQWSGFFKTDLFDMNHSFVQGMPLYISNSEPGKVTQDQPDISKAVGYPVEEMGLIISIERGIQYNQEASIGDFKSSANSYNVRSDGFIKVATGVDYKLSVIQKLINMLDEEFKTKYLIIDENLETVQFINIQELYETEGVPEGLNLFIKAF